jgi:hypothetical protein
MNKIPATKPGHLAQFGPLNHQKSETGPRKGGHAYAFKKRILEAKPIELGWKQKGR